MARVQRPDYSGHINYANSSGINGWLLDTNKDTSKIQFYLFIDGTKVGRFVAARVRLKVNARGSVSRRLGFHIPLSAEWAVTDHSIIVIQPCESSDFHISALFVRERTPAPPPVVIPEYNLKSQDEGPVDIPLVVHETMQKHILPALKHHTGQKGLADHRRPQPRAVAGGSRFRQVAAAARARQPLCEGVRGRPADAVDRLPAVPRPRRRPLLLRHLLSARRRLHPGGRQPASVAGARPGLPAQQARSGRRPRPRRPRPAAQRAAGGRRGRGADAAPRGRVGAALPRDQPARRPAGVRPEPLRRGARAVPDRRRRAARPRPGAHGHQPLPGRPEADLRRPAHGQAHRRDRPEQRDGALPAPGAALPRRRRRAATGGPVPAPSSSSPTDGSGSMGRTPTRRRAGLRLRRRRSGCPGRRRSGSRSARTGHGPPSRSSPPSPSMPVSGVTGTGRRRAAASGYSGIATP